MQLNTDSAQRYMVADPQIDDQQWELQAVREVLGAARWTIHGADQGRPATVWYSPEFRQALGYETEEEFPNTARAFSSRIHPEDRRAIVADFNAAMGDTSGKTMYDTKMRLQCKGGEYQWFRSAMRFRRDAQGHILMGAGVLVNINRIEQDKLDLHETMHEIEAIHDSLGSASWAFQYDTQGQAINVVWGDNFCKLLGYEPDELPPSTKTFIGLIAPDQAKEVESVYWNMIFDAAHTTSYAMNFHIKTKDRGYRWYRGAGRMMRRPDGTSRTFYGVLMDIDNQVRINEHLEEARREAEAANNAKTSFLFNMSHDIRTPMNAILGFRDLLEKHQDDPEKRQDYLHKIETSSHVLLSIINNVLEMARIEKGAISIDESAWSAEQFGDSISSIFNEMMEQKNLKFSRGLNVKNNYVYCDPTKLREVYINILSNAYKYTNPGGSITMFVEELPCNDPGFVVYRTSITDTGIGMSEEFLPHVFEEFSREHNTTENKIEGTGLGMPIVKRLVELMHGTIEVRSKQGVGTTFIVTLPHRIADKSKLVDHAGVKLDPKIFKGKRILLAEDNELNAEIAVEILEEFGFVMDVAEDGDICVKKLCQAPDNYYDVILMDIQMPHMNGYEATRAIRKLQDMAKASIPIIAMTANAFEEDKREAMRAGMNGHLAKPINVKELMKLLASVLG